MVFDQNNLLDISGIIIVSLRVKPVFGGLPSSIKVYSAGKTKEASMWQYKAPCLNALPVTVSSLRCPKCGFHSEGRTGLEQLVKMKDHLLAEYGQSHLPFMLNHLKGSRYMV